MDNNKIKRRILEKKFYEAWNELVQRLLMLRNSLNEEASLEAYVDAAFRIIEPLQIDLIELDKKRDCERAAYVASIIASNQPKED